MAYSTRTVSIVIASGIAVLLMLGAYALSGPLPFGKTKVADAESTQELLKAYAAKDTDSDGLPDWQEALYGTNPENPNSYKEGITDGEAVAKGLVRPKFESTSATTTDSVSVPGVNAAPTTLTDQFARALFEKYMRGRGNTPPTQAEIAKFVEQGVAELSAGYVSPNVYAMSNLRVVPGGSPALTAYAAAVEAAFKQQSVTTTQSELEYFADAVQKNDQTAYKKLNQIAAAYTATGKSFAAIPVPQEMAAAHLATTNAFMRMGEGVASMALMQSDPLRALLGLAQYDKNTKELSASFIGVYTVFQSSGVSVPQGQAGGEFYSLLAGLASSQTTP